MGTRVQSPEGTVHGKLDQESSGLRIQIIRQAVARRLHEPKGQASRKLRGRWTVCQRTPRRLAADRRDRRRLVGAFQEGQQVRELPPHDQDAEADYRAMGRSERLRAACRGLESYVVRR